MTATVAMYEKSYDHIKDRLDALNLDIEVWPFTRDGTFTVGGRPVPAAEIEVDYLWLNHAINDDGARQDVFDVVLACKSIGVLQTFNAGLDDPNYKKISDKGARICNSSAQAVAISEYTLAQVLSVTHPVALQRRQQADKVWKFTPFRELSQTHWLIIGWGPIGQEVAKRIHAFGAGMDVIRRTPAPSDVADRVGTMADLETYLPDADVILIACPLKDETRGFAGTDFFAAVKPGAILVNIARGPLIDDAAMIAALDDGRLETAILDVFHTEPLPDDDPLWSHPKVRMTPHTSFSGSGVHGRWDQLFLDNIQRFVAGQPLEQVVHPDDI